MQRRRFLLTSLAALAAPLAAEAQPTGKMHRIGFVSTASPAPEPIPLKAFRQGLRELRYVEGQNVTIDARFAEGRPERFPELVAEVIKLKVDVLVIGSIVGALAAKSANTTVPVVFAGVIDPVGQGIVPSLSHPGGNITGITFGVGGAGFAGKWVELLTQAAPGLLHVATLWNSLNPQSAPLVGELQAAARALNVKLDLIDAGTLAKLDGAFVAIGASAARGLIVSTDPFFFNNRAKLVQFSERKRLPTIYFVRDFVDGGGLMAYGGSLAESYRRAAAYVDKILKGAKPGDLPIEQPTTFELVINLKAARALGLTIPPSLLLRADQVIE